MILFEINRMVLAVPMLAICMAIGIASCGRAPSDDLPTDAHLLHKFKERKDHFAKLATMAEEDGRVVRIAPDFTWLSDDESHPGPNGNSGLSVERWNGYRSLFSQLELRKGIIRYPDTGRILFIAASKGIVVGGTSKGYAYSETELSPQLESLDNPAVMPTHTTHAYRKIDGPWYLFLSVQ